MITDEHLVWIEKINETMIYDNWDDQWSWKDISEIEYRIN